MEHSPLRNLKLASVAVVAAAMLWPAVVLAGGGGQNMLLVVNPNDESALRMANAYVAARAVPEKNIVFIAPPTQAGSWLTTITDVDFKTKYVDVLAETIRQRGLEGQIDYIATIGQPMQVKVGNTYGDPYNYTLQSFHGMLSQLTQFERGMPQTANHFRTSELFDVMLDTQVLKHANGETYDRGENAAIHHSTQYPLHLSNQFGRRAPGYDYVQWYMAGNAGYSGMHAITTQQWIDSYARTAAGDGAKPEGKVYFIDTNDIRSNAREPYWPAVQAYMTANGIAWEEVETTWPPVPKNKNDVNGAVVGSGDYSMPEGSVYLPGSWADSMTSTGGAYYGSSQTKADKFIAAGAAGTSGTVNEPGLTILRFPHAALHVFLGEGSTIGEAFYKSVGVPDLIHLQGDMLAQPHADLPAVTLISAPADGQTVSGVVPISASAGLVNPAIATGVAKLVLYVDGEEKGSFDSDSGTFELDTAGLSDGRHEIRVVAINNAQAESQGYTLRSIVVNNRGQSVAAAGSQYEAAWNQVLNIGVSAQAGDAAVQRIELRSLGRAVGQVTSAAGEVAVDAAKLAFGANRLVPVAVMSDGSEVAGEPITVMRDFNRLPGRAVLPLEQRVPGFRMEFFDDAAGRTIGETDFSGEPAIVHQASVLSLGVHPHDPSINNLPARYRQTDAAQRGDNAGLAVRATARFNITTEGEYSFFFDPFGMQYEALSILVDDVTLLDQTFAIPGGFASYHYQHGAETTRTAYLLAGEHTFTLLLSNFVAGYDAEMKLLYYFRGPDGITRRMDSSFFYTDVPEPAAGLAALSALAAGMLLRRRHSGAPM